MKTPGSAVVFTALGIGIGLLWQIVRERWWSDAALDELVRLDAEGDADAADPWCYDCGRRVEHLSHC